MGASPSVTASAAQAEDVNAFVASLDAQKMKGLIAAADDATIVFVSGCYDLLHSGHVRFFKEASALGALYVSVGNDANILALKKHRAMFPEQERQFMVQVRNFKKF